MGQRNLLATQPTGKLRVDLSGTNITTAAWAELSASWPCSTSAVMITYNGSGILKLSKGGAGAEDGKELPIYLVPGMNQEELIPLELAKGLRLSAKAVDQNVTAGELIFNCFG